MYRSYGFAPIRYSAQEYAEVLLGKGGEESDKQVFRFTDQGDRDVAMRFDPDSTTRPIRRAICTGTGNPISTISHRAVWRGERPARGRFREFMQCDFDTIGTLSNAGDIETLFVIHDLLEKSASNDLRSE